MLQGWYGIYNSHIFAIDSVALARVQMSQYSCNILKNFIIYYSPYSVLLQGWYYIIKREKKMITLNYKVLMWILSLLMTKEKYNEKIENITKKILANYESIASIENKRNKRKSTNTKEHATKSIETNEDNEQY